MASCPKCFGSGKLIINVNVISDVDEIEITCKLCFGKGTVSKITIRELKEEKDLWCNCKEPGTTYYVPEKTNKKISKSHWRCGKCQKITKM